MLLKSTQNFLRELHRIGAFKVDTEKGFRLALHDKNPTAPLSPFYINLRTPKNKGGSLQPSHVETIAHELITAAVRNHIKYDAVAGIPRAGTPFAKAIARLSNGNVIPYVCLTKRSGRARAMRVDVCQLSSKARNAKRVLLVDDLITQSDAKLLAIRALVLAGYHVAGVAVYLDREQSGVRHLANAGVPVVRVVTISKMLAFYEREGILSSSDIEKIRAYLRG